MRLSAGRTSPNPTVEREENTKYRELEGSHWNTRENSRAPAPRKITNIKRSVELEGCVVTVCCFSLEREMMERVVRMVVES